MESDEMILGDLLSRSALFAALSSCFRPPEAGGYADLSALATEAPPAWREPLSALAEGAETARGMYARVLGATGACHDSEISYRTRRPSGSLLADIAGFYRAFGYADPGEKIDHVAAQLGFVSFLYAKEAHALTSHETEASDTVRRARDSFLVDHTGRWLSAFAAAVAVADPGGFHAAAAEAAVCAVREALPPGASIEPDADTAPGGLEGGEFSCSGEGGAAAGECTASAQERVE